MFNKNKIILQQQQVIVKKIIFVMSFLLLTSCGKPLLIASDKLNVSNAEATIKGQSLFQETFKAHGGEYFSHVNDLNLSLSGNWSFWTPRIQPIVADQYYRVSSQERYLPNKGIYTSYYTGPAGNKKVVRTPSSIDIYYNNEKSIDEKRIQASAMTADAFLLFSMGPLFLSTLETSFEQLNDVFYKGQRYLRIHSEIKPGLGYAKEDEVVLWIHPKTKLTYRVDVSLNGYPSTVGAHVDVFYLEYKKVDKLILPTHVIENVVAPFSLKAHEWHVTGADINRGLVFADIEGKKWQELASQPAALF